MKHTVLVFLFNAAGDEVLLIEKKRGLGAGKWNAPGGKREEGESAEDAAHRECVEETGVVPRALQEIGRLEFLFPPDSLRRSWDNRCRVFVGQGDGATIGETEECRSFWWPVDRIDFERFWPDDRYWLPLLLEGKRFHRIYRFDREDRLLGEEVIL